jgi:nucleoside-diphosphate-sugar epimerase
MDKKVLVAGGAGFIGSYVCKYLLESGNNVLCVDNLSTGSKRNIDPFLTNKNFKFLKADVIDNSFIETLFASKLDKIYHLASPASVTHIMEYPVEAALANSLGTKNLLGIAKEQNIPILFASSSEAYGDPRQHPQKESYWGNVNSVGVRSGYDEGKRFGEALCMAYHREYDVKVKIIRIFNTYGPNSNVTDSRVVPQLVRQAILGEPLTVHGDGKQTRSFCFVSDMAKGIIAMMESAEVGPINLGNPDECTINDLAHNIIKMTNSSSEIQYVERPKDDPSQRKPDITLAKEKLFWEPKVSLKDGLTETIGYFRQMLKQK